MSKVQFLAWVPNIFLSYLCSVKPNFRVTSFSSAEDDDETDTDYDSLGVRQRRKSAISISLAMLTNETKLEDFYHSTGLYNKTSARVHARQTQNKTRDLRELATFYWTRLYYQ